jgi:hypothetical protein
MRAKVNSVVQIDPDSALGHIWGGLLCIVEDVTDWGVKCYALYPEKRCCPPEYMYLRVSHGEYAVIGPAAFCDWVEAPGPMPKEADREKT